MRLRFTVMVLVACSATAWATPVWDWNFQDDFFTVEPTGTIILGATLVNSIVSQENLTETMFTNAHAIFNGGPVGLFQDFTFSFGPQGGSGWPNLFDQFDGLNLAPGESFNFVFGVLVPDEPLEIGAVYWPGGLISLPPYNASHIWQDSTRFEVVAPAVVPEPNTIILLGVGLAAITYCGWRRRYCSLSG